MRAMVPASSIVVLLFFWDLEKKMRPVLCTSLGIVEPSKALEVCDVPLGMNTQEGELCFGPTLGTARQDFPRKFCFIFSELVSLSSAAHSSRYWAKLLLQVLISNDC